MRDGTVVSVEELGGTKVVLNCSRMGDQDVYYEVWFEHDVFITPGPRFMRLEEAVAHVRLMIQQRPDTAVSIRFPKTAVDTEIRPVSRRAVPPAPNAGLVEEHPLFDGGAKTRVATAEEQAANDGAFASFEAGDGDTSPYGNPDSSLARTSIIRPRERLQTDIMSRDQIRNALQQAEAP